MGRHEIRLRRKKMTSRRIESHKNYYGILKKHERFSLGRKVLKILVFLIMLMGIIFIAMQL